MNKRVTIKDLAKALNISIGSVDRALHKRPGISNDTLKLVMEKAEELGYQANRIAQSLSRKKKIKLGCIFPGRYKDYYAYKVFYSDIEAGINDSYKNLIDHNVEIHILKTDKLGYEQEMACVQELKKEGVDGIAICPGHRTYLNSLINDVVDKGIKVVTVATDAPESKRLTCVSTDSFNNGQIAGDLMSNFIEHKGQVAIMTGSHEVTDHQEKVKGFIDVIYSYPNACEVVGIYETGDEQDKIYSMIKDIIINKPNLAGIYVNTANSVYACNAVIDSGMGGKIYIIGTDFMKDNIPYFESGVMQASIYQDPYTQGYKAVQILYDSIVSGKHYGPNDYVKPDIITKHNYKYFRCCN